MEELITGFLFHCKHEKSLSEKTIKAYQIDLTQFKSFMESNKWPGLVEHIDRDSIRKYVFALQEKYKVKTVKRKIACTKAFFNYYEFEKEILMNPFRRLKIRIKEPLKMPIVLNLTEVQKIFSLVYKLRREESDTASYYYKSVVRDIAVVELLFATGLRVSELTHLRHENINLVEGTIKILGKGNKERLIQLCNPNVLKALRDYQNLFKDVIENSGYFFNNRLSRKLSEQSVRNTIKRLAGDSEIKKKVTPHTYRHSLATTLLEEGVDIKYIQILLGHSSIMTTQIYTHVTNLKQKEILSSRHPRNRFSFT